MFVRVYAQEQTAGSVSSLEGFSPSSHSGEMNHHRAAAAAAGGGGGVGGGGLVRRAGVYEEGEGAEIPWILIPITGLSVCLPSQDILKTNNIYMKCSHY